MSTGRKNGSMSKNAHIYIYTCGSQKAFASVAKYIFGI